MYKVIPKGGGFVKHRTNNKLSHHALRLFSVGLADCYILQQQYTSFNPQEMMKIKKIEIKVFHIILVNIIYC